jgi:threonine/homoserine/homoserine lactone efflux protein
VLLLLTALRKWRHRPPGWGDAELPAWATQLADASSQRCASIGAALGGVNPKNLALVAAAAAVIGQSGTPAGQQAAAAAIFVALASASVVGAVAARVVAGERVASTLEDVKTFMLRHETAIVMVVLVVFGLKLVGDGLAGI